MKRVLVAFAVVLIATGVDARKPPEPNITADGATPSGPFDGSLSPNPRFAIAALNTTVLASFTFDVGATCTQQGWTVVDGTAQAAVFWHVDDFAGANVNPGDSLAVLAGTKSLWCGARAATSGPTCGYLTLPGYGSSWNQSWRTKTCIAVSGDNILDVSFLLETDSEPAYDATFLEYTTDCTSPFTGWVQLDGGIGEWDDIQGPIAAGGAYAVAGSPVKVRLRFAADGGFADDDALYDSHAGATIIDNLDAEGLATEDFEGEALNATTSNDWEGVGEPGYGASYLALFSGSTLLQQDACAKNLSCMWAAIAGSSETYACGGFPLQAAVPKRNSEGQYINAQIWSPLIPLVGTGSVINLQFSIYRDLQIDGLVFNIWDVRAVIAGCDGEWRSRGFVYFGAQKDWFVNTFPVGDLIPADATHMRVRLGVIDMCPVWCGPLGTGSCHSHSPLLDTVKVYRVDIFGPVYSTRDIDMFQDTFPVDGTDTGIGRADAALSITAQASPTILPGDSARIIVSDPITAVPVTNPSGLATDNLGGNNGDRACYLWVHVLDSGVPSGTKTGAVLSGGPLFPFKDTQVADGKTWTRIQCWLRVNATSTFVVDLNDNLFQAGDVIEFFFAAHSTSGDVSYCSGSALTFVQSDVDLAAETASEFTILPLFGNGAANADVLYVDGMDGRGAQVFWDTAFEQVSTDVDRYDVRGPTSSVSNRPGARVTDVAQQLNANYKVVLWDSGDLTQSLGDGTGAPEKSNDYAMVNAFLGGIYICGDDFPAGLNSAAGASAVTFKSTYVTYSLVTGNHRPSFGTSPLGVGTAGNAFAGDTFFIFGGCPLINDFDVMTPVGTTVKQLAYNAAGNNAAVVSKVTGNARVMISGFSFIYIRDDDENGVMDRAKHLYDMLLWLNGSHAQPTEVPVTLVDRLEQNYPNPFNPRTTIAFSIKERGRVRIDVFNVAGQLVKSLLNETRAAGSYSDVRWDGTNDFRQAVASGVYFCRLVTDRFDQTRKMVLVQ